ncbi:hypothetical protein M9H77_17173 [Catharanthus roseus]|uniref:Uncharacterized protein n=1 Tax=Catharanthus roseus TaxID=4058 RepID=A0ACC0B3V9_CATRO|nr:hypothetical protein M9H77_17173 [Catharanthus roseus]
MHELSFKELKLILELHAFYVTLVGNLMVNSFTYKLALDVAYMFKCSSSCAYLEKQLLDNIDRIKLSYHDLKLLHDNLFFDLIVANVLSSCASMWSKIHIFPRSFVESGYVERVSWFSCSLCGVFHAKLREEFAENCDYMSSFLYASMKNLDGFIPSIQLLYFVSHQFEFPYDEQKVLIVDEFLKALLFENIHGFQFYHFHFMALMRLLISGKKMNGSLKVLKEEGKKLVIEASDAKSEISNVRSACFWDEVLKIQMASSDNLLFGQPVEGLEIRTLRDQVKTSRFKLFSGCWRLSFKYETSLEHQGTRIFMPK